MKLLFRKAAKAVALAAPAAAMAAVVPKHMIVTDVMASAPLASSTLIPLDLTVGVQEMAPVSGQEVFTKHAGALGSVAFVVRRPG
jgi:hypothetical protein